MLEKIKAKLHDHFFSLQNDNKTPKNKIPEKTNFIKNTHHPNKIFSIIQPEANRSGHNLLSTSTRTVKNPVSEPIEPFRQADTPAVTDVRKTLPRADCASKFGQFVGKGSRGTVYRNGDTVTKVMKLNTSNIDQLLSKKLTIEHEARMCNEYWMKENGSSPATVKGNKITMPFVEGTLPDRSETYQAVKNLYNKGLMMGDAAPSNFVKAECGKVVPVDFGLVFMKDDIDGIDKQVKTEIVHDYIKGGHRYIPTELTSQYIACLQEMDRSLGANSPTRNMNVKELSRAGFLAPV